MAVQTTISSLSQTAASNGPDGATDPPSALDDQERYHGSFIAQHRDGKGFSAEADVASAGTCDIGAANSLFVRITGTTTITSFGTPSMPGPRHIRFAGALTLTHNASTLILPGSSNITTAAGDTCIARPISGGWVVSHYTRADGKVLIGALTSGTVESLSGTSKDFTGIPSWVKRISILPKDASTNGGSPYIVQIGDSGGLETAGYSGSVTFLQNGTTPATDTATTNGFALCPAVSSGASYTGRIVLELQDAATNTWICSVVGCFATGSSSFGVSSKALSGTLDRIRITTAGGVNTFDAGSVNIIYE